MKSRFLKMDIKMTHNYKVFISTQGILYNFIPFF